MAVMEAAEQYTAKKGNYVYRALTQADAESVAAGRGIFAKAPQGTWTLENHLIRGSSKAAVANSPWISTSTERSIAEAFTSGNGLIRIDLSKIPASSIQQGWLNLPRSSAAYHYSIWQQEVTIFKFIPQEAIQILK